MARSTRAVDPGAGTSSVAPIELVVDGIIYSIPGNAIVVLPDGRPVRADTLEKHTVITRLPDTHGIVEIGPLAATQHDSWEDPAVAAHEAGEPVGAVVPDDTGGGAAASGSAQPPSTPLPGDEDGDGVVSEEELDNLIRELYPAMAAWIDHPEVGPILEQAAKENWSPIRLQNAIQETEWWKTTSDAMRQWDALEESNPGEAAARVQAKAHELWRMLVIDYGIRDVPWDVLESLARNALRQGWNEAQLQRALEASAWFVDRSQSEVDFIALATLNPAELRRQLGLRAADIQVLANALGVKLESADLADLAERALRGGWSDNQLRLALIERLDLSDPDSLLGQAADVRLQIDELAAEYLLQISDSAKNKWVRQILMGDASIDGFEMYAREQAQSRFPLLSTTIDRGISIQQWADPYRQLVAELHGIAPESVDFYDPKYMKMLESGITDDKGNTRPMTLAEAADYLRKMPEFWETDSARQRISSLTETFARTFGEVR